MKKRTLILTLLTLVAVIFASAFPVSAIGFVAEEKYEAVFVIHSGNSLGSGFSLGENCVITNAHVIDDRNHVKVLCYDGTEHEAFVLGMDTDMDIAVLVVPGAKFPVLEVAPAEQIRTGDDVYAIGAPKSMAYTLTKGVISAKERQLGNYTYVQTDAPINSGNSGGPLLSDSGQVVGMNTMKLNDSEGIGLAIPISVICTYLQSLQIPLDAGGNVVGALEKPQEPETLPQEPGGSQPQVIVDTRYAKQAAIATIIATLSVALNVVLIAVNATQKRKKTQTPPPPVQDPRERTDFDIEILE